MIEINKKDKQIVKIYWNTIKKVLNSLNKIRKMYQFSIAYLIPFYNKELNIFKFKILSFHGMDKSRIFLKCIFNQYITDDYIQKNGLFLNNNNMENFITTVNHNDTKSFHYIDNSIIIEDINYNESIYKLCITDKEKKIINKIYKDYIEYNILYNLLKEKKEISKEILDDIKLHFSKLKEQGTKYNIKDEFNTIIYKQFFPSTFPSNIKYNTFDDKLKLITVLLLIYKDFEMYIQYSSIRRTENATSK